MTIDESIVIDEIDDSGTFFYKLRNGSLPFEYDTEKQLEKICLLIENRNQDIVCGLLSAIIANYITENYDFSNNVIGFIIFLFVFFVISKTLLYFGNKLIGCIQHSRRKKIISEEDEEEIQDYFFKKIVVQTAYVFSVVKRSKELESSVDKQELCYMYAIQGAYAIRKISVQLGKIVNETSAYKFRTYIEAIGKDNMIGVLDILLNSAQYIWSYSEGIRESDIKRINDIKGLVNSL